MRRLFLPLLAAAALVSIVTPGHAQMTTDQLNKLSLEALTAPPPRPPAPRRVAGLRSRKAAVHAVASRHGAFTSSRQAAPVHRPVGHR